MLAPGKKPKKKRIKSEEMNIFPQWLFYINLLRSEVGLWFYLAQLINLVEF